MLTSAGPWVVITPDNIAEKIPSRSGIGMPEITGTGGPFAVCNHLVTSGLWMWYREYEREVLPSSLDTINHCATSLWQIKDLGPPRKKVYGPVLFTGSIHRGPLSEDSVTRLHLLARLARTESERLGLESV